MFDISAFAQGLALGLGMFVCPGPKDILILRQALFRRSAVELIAVGTVSDAFLIWLGMAGASAALNRAPELQTSALWLGVLLLVGHGLLSAGRAFRGTPNFAELGCHDQVLSRGKTLAALLAVSFLNPVAWLDTVLVIGTFGAALPEANQFNFAFGAITASVTWFLALVMGARVVRRLMTKPKSWQILDALVATAMFGLAAYVASGLL